MHVSSRNMTDVFKSFDMFERYILQYEKGHSGLNSSWSLLIYKFTSPQLFDSQMASETCVAHLRRKWLPIRKENVKLCRKI